MRVEVFEEWPTPASIIIVLFFFPHRRYCELQRKEKKENDCNARIVFESLDCRRETRRTVTQACIRTKKKWANEFF